MSDSSGKIITGLLVGVVVGYAIGIFTAPRSGEETRQKMAEFNRDAKEKFIEFNKNAKEKIDELAAR
jgi:gas vesicle protein